MARRDQGLVAQLGAQIEDLFAAKPRDIVDAIKQDHSALRNFLGTLKDTDKPLAERRRAYAAMSTLLKSHSDSEEKAVYVPVRKLSGRELHLKVAEGYVEHQLADDLLKRIERCKDALRWSAHVNVLAETIEHHLKEEERSLLPLVRKKASPAANRAMLAKFVALRAASQKHVSKKNAGVLKSKT